MSRKIPDSEIKKLFGLSAGRCNLCGTCTISDRHSGGYTIIGQMAHNISYSDNKSSPRCIDGKTGDNSYENLILLCANCHIKVDRDEEYYTVSKLNKIRF